MKKALRPILLTVAAFVCLFSASPTFAQDQHTKPSHLSASAKQELAKQIKDLLLSMDEYADSYLRDHHEPATPSRIKVLSLHSQAYREAMVQALDEMVQAPLSEDDFKALQQRLSPFVESGLRQFDAPFGASADIVKQLEARCEQIVKSWSPEGHEINKEYALWKLRSELSTFFQLRLTEEQRTQITEQLTEIGDLVAKEIIRLIPDIDRKNLARYTQRQIELYSSTQKDPFNLRMHLISPKQIRTNIEQKRGEAANLVEAMSKNPRSRTPALASNAMLVQVFRVLWTDPLKDMTSLPDSRLLADYPQDLPQRYQDYYMKTVISEGAPR